MFGLESFVTRVAVTYLGKYVKNIEINKIRLALWYGQLELTNLEFDEDVINKEFVYPICLKSGFIGHLQINIPWNKLGSEPITVKVENLYFVFGPNKDNNWLNFELAKLKQKQIQELESEKNNLPLNDWSYDNRPFWMALITKIIDNFQIHINNLHVRYETDFAIPSHPTFACGITLQNLSVVSTDPLFSPAFISEPHSIIYKMIIVKTLALYFNPNEPPLSSMSVNESMEKMISKEGRKSSIPAQYIIPPVSAEIRLIINRFGTEKKIPAVHIAIDIADTKVVITREQYASLNQVFEFYLIVSKRWKYRSLRPKVSPKQDPKAWWKFAILANAKDKIPKLTRKFTEERRRNRIRYMNLYESKVLNRINDFQAQELAKFELELDPKDIVFFRSLVKKHLSDMGYIFNVSGRVINSLTSSSWFPWNWEWKTWRNLIYPDQDKPIDRSIWELTEHQKMQLYNTIDYYQFIDNSSRVQDSEDTIYFEFLFHLHLSSIILGGNESHLGELRFEEFSTQITIFKTTTQIAITLQLMQLIDIQTPDTHFRYLISPLRIESSRFFDLLIQYKPYDRPGIDMFVELYAEPLEICYNQKWINSFVSFFASATTPGVVQSSAKTFSKVKSQYSEQIAFTIEKNPSILLSAFIQAPKILIPASVTEENSPLLVANLGTVSILCQPNQEILRTHPNSEELLYKTFNVVMTSLSLRTFILRRSENTIIENFNVQFALDVCVTSQPNLARSRLSFKLPNLKVTLSPSMLNNLLCVFNSILSGISEGNENLKQIQKNLEDEVPEVSFSNFKQSLSLKVDLDNSPDQLNFRGYFFISKLAVYLSHDGVDLHPFVSFNFEDFEAQIKNTSFQSDIAVQLNSIKIENLLSPIPESFIFKTSMNDKPTSNIYMKYTSISKNSPNFKGVDEEIVIFLDYFFSSVGLEIVNHLAQFLFYLQDFQKVELPYSSNSITPVRSITIQGKVWVLLLELQKKPFAESKWEGACLIVHILTYSQMEFIGKLDRLSIVDPSLIPSRSYASLFKDEQISPQTIISTESGKLFEFSYTTKLYDQEKILYPEIGSILGFRINGLSVIYLTPFFQSLIQYISNLLSIFSKQISTTPNQPYPKLKLEAILNNITITLISEEKKSNYIELSINELYFFNYPLIFKKQTLESYKIIIQSASLSSHIVDTENQYETLLPKFQIEFDIVPDYEVHPLKLQFHIPEFKVFFTLDQLKLLINLINDQIRFAQQSKKNTHDSTQMLFSLQLSLERALVNMVHLETEKVVLHKPATKFRDGEIKLKISAELNEYRNYDSFFIAYRMSGNLPVEVHQSEVMRRTCCPKWPSFSIPISNICNDETIKIFFYDQSRFPSKKDVLIGVIETNFSTILETNQFKLKKQKKEGTILKKGIVNIRHKLIRNPETPMVKDVIQEKKEFKVFAVMELFHWNLSYIQTANTSVLTQVATSINLWNPKTQKKSQNLNFFTFSYVQGPNSKYIQAKVKQIDILFDIELFSPMKDMVFGAYDHIEDLFTDTNNKADFFIGFDISHFSLIFQKEVKDPSSNKLNLIGSLSVNDSVVQTEREVCVYMKFNIVREYPSNISYLFHDSISFNFELKPSAIKHSILNFTIDPIDLSLVHEDYLILMKNMNVSIFSGKQKKTKKEMEENPTFQGPYNLVIDGYFGGLSFRFLSRHKEVPPLIYFSLSELLVIGSTFSQLLTRTVVRGKYFNMNSASWENFVEPFEITFGYSPAAFNISIEGPCDATISTSLLSNISAVWSDEYSFVAQGKEYHPLLIINQTWIPWIYEIVDEGKWSKIEPQQTQPVVILSGSSELYNLRTLKICFFLGEEISDSLKIETNFFEKTSKICKFATEDNKNQLFIIESQVKEGIRQIVLKSSVVIKNLTPETLEFMMYQSNQNAFHATLKPGEDTSVPVQLCIDGKIKFHPKNLKFSEAWSSEISLYSLVPNNFFVNISNQDNYAEYGIEIKESVLIENNVDCFLAHDICIYVPIEIENLLSTPVEVQLCDFPKYSFDKAVSHGHISPMSKEIESTPIIKYSGLVLDGQTVPVYVGVRLLYLRIQLPGFSWSSLLLINNSGVLHCRKKDCETDLIIHCEPSRNRKTLCLVLYAKIWLINMTEFNLTFYLSNFMSSKKKIPGQETFPSKNLNFGETKAWLKKDTYRPIIFSPVNTNTLFYFELENDSNCVSKGLNCHAIQEGSIEVKHKSYPNRSFYFGISVSVGRQRYRRTKVVRITPAYILVNKMKETVYFQQENVDYRGSIPPNSLIPFHWRNAQNRKLLSISLDLGNVWSWSGGFSFDETTFVKIKKIQDNKEYFVRVDVKSESSSEKGLITYIIFRPKSRKFVPYRIENFTRERIIYWQEGHTTHYSLESGRVQNYAWDEPSLPHSIWVHIPNYNFRSIYQMHKIKVRSQRNNVLSELYPEGITRVLRLTDIRDNQEKPLTQTKLEEVDDEIIFTYSASIPVLTFSFINSIPEEIVGLYFKNVLGKVTESPHSRGYKLSIRVLQVDNQLLFTPYRIILRHHASTKKFFEMSLVQSKKYVNIYYFNYFSILFQAMDLALDKKFVNSLLNFIHVNVDEFYQKDLIIPRKDEDLESQNHLIYFNTLLIHPIKITVSYYSEKTNSNVPDPLDQLIGGIVESVPNIQGATMKLNALYLEHPFFSFTDLKTKILHHYLTQLVRESYHILGSFEFLGSPGNLFAGVGEGIRDFFYEPIHGIVFDHQDFRQGLKKGTKSLIKNTISGLFDSTSKITSQIGVVVSAATFDRDFIHQRNARHTFNKPQTFYTGVKEGLKELTSEVMDGVTGIISVPAKRIQDKQGPKSVVKGLTIGLTGVCSKSTAGVVDMVTRTMQGLSNATSFDEHHRVRYPRFIDDNGILECYNEEKSLRYYVLKTVGQSKFASDICDFHVMALKNILILVTNQRVMKIKKINQDIFELKSQYPFSEVVAIQKSQSQIFFSCVKSKIEPNIGLEKKTIGKQKAITVEKEKISELYQVIVSKWKAFHQANDTFIHILSSSQSFREIDPKRGSSDSYLSTGSSSSSKSIH